MSMWRAIGGAVVLGLVLVGVSIAPSAAAAPAPTTAAADVDIESAARGAVEGSGVWGGLALIALGGLLLVGFIEKLISYLTRAAVGLGASVFSMAIVFTGFEFDDTALALVFAGGGLENAALGTALGTALAIVGITLAVAAMVTSFSVDVPRDYLALFAGSPLVLLAVVSLGELGLVHGLGLFAAYLASLGYVVAMERRRDGRVFRDTELVEEPQTDGGIAPEERLEPIYEDALLDRDDGAAWFALAVAALVGVVVGSMLVEAGSAMVIERTGIDQTVFGATVVTLLLTFENVLLTLEPVRRGFPEVGIGHVIGSVLFSVTANVGFVLLLADLTVGRDVVFFHLPALLVMTVLAAYFVSTGTVRRRHGILFGVLYILYWVVAVFVLGGVPVSA